MRNPDVITISDVLTCPDGTVLTVHGWITQIHTHLTHHRDPWAQFLLADVVAVLDVYVFPQHYAVAAALLVPGAALTVTGRLNRPARTPGHIYAQHLTTGGVA